MQAWFHKDGHTYMNKATSPDLFCNILYYELETLDELEIAYKQYYRIGTEREREIPKHVQEEYKKAYKNMERRLSDEAFARYEAILKGIVEKVSKLKEKDNEFDVERFNILNETEEIKQLDILVAYYENLINLINSKEQLNLDNIRNYLKEYDKELIETYLEYFKLLSNLKKEMYFLIKHDNSFDVATYANRNNSNNDQIQYKKEGK